ncbi:hypothetical protein JOC86_000657 [Bacillus pakistanensis]|uniref:Uncharacterized protein n=1 Tax=Rossellomorea pakistanensis TaxID=992288 RepID=A0ABS2N8C4_9BACI|nr:hypothetical protein [Bacillus pakistanensis]MBM7584120.1 hypothetical protein [Bacillus pakistanensis]
MFDYLQGIAIIDEYHRLNDNVNLTAFKDEEWNCTNKNWYCQLPGFNRRKDCDCINPR